MKKNIIFSSFRKKISRKSLADFPLRGGGGYPPFPLRKKTFFFSDWFSVKGGGGGYPLNGRIPLKRKWQPPLLWRQLGKILCYFLEKFTQLKNFYTTASRDSRDKSHLWTSPLKITIYVFRIITFRRVEYAHAGAAPESPMVCLWICELPWYRYIVPRNL